MKRKNYIFSLASALLMGTMALSLTACSSEDNIANNTQQPAQGEARTYTVSIPATFSDNAGTRAVEFDNSSTPAITAKFVENEKVYVYNKNPATPQLLGGYLLVKNVSTDKQSCELQGQVTGTISPDDEVALLYNLNNINSPVYSVTDFYYEYNDQKGTAASCVDGATATMKVKEIGDDSNNYKMTFYAPGDADKTEAKALFANLQSMFRFQFADATAPTTPIKVKTLNIQSKNVQLARRYYLPVGSTEPYWSVAEGIDVTPTTATDDYLYVALCFKENGQPNNELYFSVTDDAGYAYKGSKSGPTGGFQNGKYYYNTAPIALAKLSAPTITWTNPSTPVAANTSSIYAFPVGADADPDYDITVSGTCNGYAFDISSTGNTGTIRLNNLNATWKNANSTTPFIAVSTADVLIELTGANRITCNTDYAIHDGNNLKLSCTGASATLTVTASSSDFCGILGDSNYEQSQVGGAYNYYPTTTELDVTSQLAAPGYTVTRSARTYNNADGTYTWTYTVRPVSLPLTNPAVGEVIGSDGKNYAYASLPSGVTAVAKICYVNGEHGLALALADEGYMNWSDAISTCAAHTPAFTGGTWKLATQDEWNNMKNVAGVGAVNLRDGFTSVGGTNMGTGWYWSYTDATTDTSARVYRFDGSTDWASGGKGNSNYVRACLAW